MSGSDNKLKEQEDYIYRILPKIKTCTILDNMYYNIDKISTPIVKDIINNKFKNGLDMDAVVCMFNNLFLSSSHSKQDGLLVLSVHVSKWIKKLEKINVDSVSGYVYFSDILSDIQVIIKLPQNASGYTDMIREYFIGITSINKLRYTLPNFVYTFGAFLCPMEKGQLCNGDKTDSIPFVVFEKIPGENMQKMLENKKLTFPQYLRMFVQVLLALEVAQRTINFTHFDFHTANLMCRTIKNQCKYTVPLDNLMYEVIATEYLPVIIDFGLSTVTYDNHIIGSYKFPEYGMKNYMIQGVDMFKFLFHSCLYSKGNLQRQIINLLYFYGQDDPYKILIKGYEGLDEGMDEYVKKGSYSRVATNTPLEFLNWILDQQEYNDITSTCIKKKERGIYVSLSYPITMFKRGRDDAIKLLNRSIKSSYIMSKYFLYVVEGYNNKFKSTKNIHNYIVKSKVKMIKNDYKLLDEYTKLVLPDIMKIKDDSKRILMIKINSKILKTDKTNVLKLIERYFKNITFFTDILPYLQYVYTIREINLEKIYSKFLTSFLVSPQYKMYNQNFMFVIRTQRWCSTLLNILE